MKRSNLKFLVLVLFLLCVSLVVLSAGLYLVNVKEEEPREYEFSEQSFDFELVENENVSESAPTPQDTLKQKFEEMYDIDAENKSITVISKQYLSTYWKSNYEKEEIKSLTVDEILFIVQDSIRIYEKYDKIILEGYESEVKYGYISVSAEFDRRYPKSDDYVWDGDESETFWRVPYLETQTITAYDGYKFESRSSAASSDPESAVKRVMADIQQIVFYRIEALSSPKTFIQCAEFLSLVGENTREFSSKFPESVYYCSGMKTVEDRKNVLDAMFDDYFRSASIGIDCGDIDLVMMSGDYFSKRFVDRTSGIGLMIQNKWIFDEVILTDDIELECRKYLNETISIKYRLKFIAEEKERNATIHILPKDKKFSMSGYFGRRFGTYELIEDTLRLISIDSIHIVSLKENGGVGVLYYSTEAYLIDGVIVEREEPSVKW